MRAAADPEGEGELLVADSAGDDLFATPVMKPPRAGQVFGPVLGDLTAIGVEPLCRQLIFAADFQVRPMHGAHFCSRFVRGRPEPAEQSDEQELHGDTCQGEGRGRDTGGAAGGGPLKGL